LGEQNRVGPRGARASRQRLQAAARLEALSQLERVRKPRIMANWYTDLCELLHQPCDSVTTNDAPLPHLASLMEP
jgi:hypothetical protein